MSYPIKECISSMEDLLDDARILLSRCEWFCRDANSLYQKSHDTDDVMYVMPEVNLDLYDDKLDSAVEQLGSLRPFEFGFSINQKVTGKDAAGLSLTHWVISINGVVQSLDDLPDELIKSRMMQYGCSGPATVQTAIFILYKVTGDADLSSKLADMMADVLSQIPVVAGGSITETVVLEMIDDWNENISSLEMSDGCNENQSLEKGESDND